MPSPNPNPNPSRAQLRFWHCDEGGRSLDQISSVELTGFVNGIAVAPSGKFAAAAVGQELWLGG